MKIRVHYNDKDNDPASVDSVFSTSFRSALKYIKKYGYEYTNNDKCYFIPYHQVTFIEKLDS